MGALENRNGNRVRTNMTIRFGRPTIDYKADGTTVNDEGEVEYLYSPTREVQWYEPDAFLTIEYREIEKVKVIV